jgi:plasmid stabilization system protein ParE
MIVHIQPLAGEDLDNIYDYYKEKKKSLQAASNVVNDILDEIENLRTYLSVINLQPIYKAKGVDFFSVVANKRKNYKVIFFITQNIINIVSIWDCRRSPDKMKEIFEDK